MNRRWAAQYGMQSGDQALNTYGNFGQLNQLSPSAALASPSRHGHPTSDQVASLPPSLIFGVNYSTPRNMPARDKASKVMKADAAPRRGSRHSSLSSTAHEQLEAYVQQPSNSSVIGDTTDLGRSPTVDANNNLDDAVQLAATGVLGSSLGSTTGLPSSIQQALIAEREGLRLDQHYISESHHSPSPAPTNNANLSEGMNGYMPNRTAADVAMDAYGDSLRIDSALCKKLAGEHARREPTQRRSDQRLNIERRSNVEALLAHITGRVAIHACKNCHKGHGPWTQCVVYDGQMCGSCTNCWFNASGSRCTFHENNNPQPPHFASSASAVTSAQASQPAAAYQHSSAAATPPAAPSQPDILQWAMADDTRQFLSQTMGDIVCLSKRGRYIARIEAAAKELGMRIAEYDEYLRTPEGIAEQQRMDQAQLTHQSHVGDVPVDENSSSRPLT